MERGRNTKMESKKEKSESSSPGNCSVGARNLRKSELGAVVFGCKHHTMGECLDKKLFGLPSSHFSYVKNVSTSLPLFLFNYSDRTLHGIFEAAGPGQMNIDQYAWITNEGTQKTAYPAQVRVSVRRMCQPLFEEKFGPVIGHNYYEKRLFWFELDKVQTRKLIELFSSSPMPQNVPRPPTASVSRALPTSVIAKADDVIDNPILEKVTGRVNEINLHSVSQDDQVSRMTDVNWKENANKKWSDLFKS
ncbi:Galactose oxidase/kelch [Abeliophyllum distichum]|uniref:Galactose oxidase/kelch n=1 Tax=Abeliophyllum distichum TaxID=126358 RepID=A0ABD1UP15_9LAMI